MPWIFLIGSAVLGTLTGFVSFSKGAIHNSPVGRAAQGILSIASLSLIVIAFFRFGWKIGLLEILVIFGSSNMGLSTLNSMSRRDY